MKFKENRPPLKLLVVIVLALFFGVALYFRIALAYDQIFSGDWIKFAGTDNYYHMRIVDNLVYNFPHIMSLDPYMLYPSGMKIGGIHFFDLFLASIIWLVGLGSPTQHTIDVVGVYFPAILGALTVIPVYFIGKELFNRWAGVFAAGLIAIMPGEFLGRSVLGFTDHHVAETLFTTIAILFLILAIKAAKQKLVSFDSIKHRQWTALARPLVYSLLAGIFLGIYLLTWIGALLFVLLITVYFIVQFIIDHLKRKPTDYLCLTGVTLFFVALIIYLLVSQDMLYVASLIIALLIPLALSGVSRLLAGDKIKPAYYPLALVGLGLAGLAIFHIINPSLLGSMLEQFSIFTPRGVELAILEMQPLLFPTGGLSLSIAWSNFTTGFFFSLIALGILIYLAVKQGDAEKSLLVVWSLVILAATLGQRRFAYYFAVNVALLTAYISILAYFAIQFVINYLRGKSTSYLSWQIRSFAGFKELGDRPAEIPKKTERKKARLKKTEGGPPITSSYINMALATLIIFILVFVPNIILAKVTAEQAQFAPSDAWCSSLSWLKENTPDPFGDPDSYYELYEPTPVGEPYNYPESAYGVLAGWEYGHWITRIAHRIPTSNPFQHGAASVAQIFTAQDENKAREKMEELGAKYVIVDHATVTTKFHSVATFAGSIKENFYDVYYQPQDDQLVPVQLLYPDYYRSLAVRLYNFDGGPVIPKSSVVISFQERVNREGEYYKEITGSQTFPTYEEAVAYISEQTSGDYKIVGTSPFVSPVPLEELKHCKLVYSSDIGVMQPDAGMVPAVKIFEYVE